MSKKLLTLIHSLLALGIAGQAIARNMTVEVYEHGQYKGTMSVPEGNYQNLANRMRGTGVTVRPQPRPDAAARRQAAEQRMAQWKKENEQRRRAALEKQEQWKRDFERRQRAAQDRMAEWNRQAEQRQIAARARMAQWNRDFERRHAAAQQGFEAWRMAR